MNKKSTSNGIQIDRSAMQKKAVKKQAGNRTCVFLHSILPRTKKGVIKLALGAIVLIAIAGFIPVPYTFAKTVPVPFNVTDQLSAGLELGDVKVLLEGAEGSKKVEIKSFQSIWGRILGFQPIQQQEINSTTIEAPVNKIVANGSKKYQYMLCTDGRYRYFTDEQFKDPSTGFTSKSADDCKANNQGEKVKLADSPDGTINNVAPPGTVSKAPVTPGCKEISIPFATEYQNASYLPKGTQQVASQGVNGFILRCPGSTDIKVPGVNQLVLNGTGRTAAEIQAENEAAEIRRQQEEAARDQRYYIALANCVQSLRVQGMPQSSAEANCRSIVRR